MNNTKTSILVQDNWQITVSPHINLQQSGYTNMNLFTTFKLKTLYENIHVSSRDETRLSVSK